MSSYSIPWSQFPKFADVLKQAEDCGLRAEDLISETSLADCLPDLRNLGFPLPPEDWACAWAEIPQPDADVRNRMLASFHHHIALLHRDIGSKDPFADPVVWYTIWVARSLEVGTPVLKIHTAFTMFFAG